MQSEATQILPPAGPAAQSESVLGRHIANPWVAFLLRRLLSLVIVLFFLALASFLMVRLIPGDPALIVAGQGATLEQLATIRHQLGIDVPAQVQFVNFWGRRFHAALGESF